MEQITFARTRIAGLLRIQPRIIEDSRGRFIKTLVEEEYEAAGLATRFAEEYHSVSRRGVVRGMHFQTPPADYEKIIFCTSGSVFDAVVDLRLGSPTYGMAEEFSLDESKGGGLYVPSGCAHGFAALSEWATVAYKVTTPHSPGLDGGVLWSSVGVNWPFENPCTSVRDEAFPTIEEFASPFVYGGEQGDE